ncbi:hypothetical protein VN12_00430 [Pirellula sp. SH-Sr6A]|uniref:hypothetical protein n=1 Tax=Pirellula sp. SH-Sr6A TaxID=1632865 RepID=UPI00078CE86D|nr:hypothetical protein [Pirellula sp. SH-Sr6A]AMV30548.1 hypothetical protein VN12_00430 [Pirellula sp. SH-Sr6A]
MLLHFTLWMLATTSVVGQEVATGGSDKDWVYVENHQIKVGVLRSHGGAMAYLSDRGTKDNVLNHYDHGRLVQQSYYGVEDGSKWVKQPWRYNPVQGGDYRGAASKLLEFRSTDHEIYTKTTPRHWATGELLTECIMEQTIDLTGPVVRIRYAFEYTGNKVHAARHQETPAVFVEPRHNRLFYYEGNDAWSGRDLSQRIPGWPNESIKLSESWAAYVDDSGQGLGVYVPGCNEATCYRYMGGSGSDCSYIAPLRTFSLHPGLRFTYTAYFTLGTPATIRTRFQAINSLPPQK